MNYWRTTVVAVLGVVVLSCLAFALPASAALTQVGERQLVNQSQDEIEPALITYTQSGTEYSASVWMNFDPSITNPNSTLKCTAWTSNGSVNTSTIPAVSGYTRYADPVLVKHPTMTRIFLVAVALNTDTPGEIKSAVVVWYSTSGGWYWSSPTIITSEVSTTTYLDKPVATTAPDGKLWIAYVRHAVSHALLVQSGTLAGSPAVWSWSAPMSLTSSSNLEAPQIMVDADSDVYVLYTYYSAGWRIGFLWDDAATTTVSFTALTGIPTVGTLYGGSASYISVSPSVTLRAYSIPVAKLDRTRRRISVAWHEANGTNRSRLQFATYRTDTQGPWTNVTLAATGGHDVNVGMDYDTNGNYLVTWYAFPYQESVYFNMGKYVTFDVNGNPTWGADSTITGRLGDVAILTPRADGHRFIGDYHDVSYTNGAFKAVHLVIVSPWGDPWAFNVHP